MRTDKVTIGGKEIIIREKLIKELKQDIFPKIEPAWQLILQGKVATIADTLADQLQAIFPELNNVDLDECYPSEIEAFMEAWVDVNFIGLKRIAQPLMSLMMRGLRTSE